MESLPVVQTEIIYPGMHSDVGGGYPVRDQGKSCGDSGEILSQIALHDMYLAAFDSGAPLAVYSKFVTPLIKGVSPLRIMSPSSVKEFTIANSLTKRFNIWRQTLLNTTLQGTEEMIDTREGYHSYQLAQVLESAISDQIGWITAWRIGRYANNSLLVQPFYIKAPQLDKDGLDKEAKARKEQMENIEKERANKQKGNGTLDESNQGIPILDPTNAQYQLREAAREFQSDYKGWTRDINGSVMEKAIQILVDVIPKYPVYLINGDDEAKEYQQIKAMGDGLYPQFFIDSLGTGTRTQPCAELLALYDDQVHDSRAWFMQSSLGGREPWGGYFRYRMIYFGDEANKELKLISADGKVVGDQPTSNRVIYWMESKTVSRG